MDDGNRNILYEITLMAMLGTELERINKFKKKTDRQREWDTFRKGVLKKMVEMINLLMDEE